MTGVYRKLAILGVLTAATGACGIIPGLHDDGGDCSPDPVPVQMALLDRMAPNPAEAKAVPPLVPTIETYPSCQALQDDLRADWQYHQTYYKQGKPQPSYPRNGTDRVYRQPQPAPKKGCSTSFAGSAKKASAAEAPVDDVAAESGAMPPQMNPMGSASNSAGSGSGAAADNKTFTNTQEKNVDEADSVKIGDHHIYVQRAGEVQVVGRQTLALIGTLPLTGLWNTTLYADGDTLVIVGMSDTGTTVRVMTAEGGQLPVLQKQHDMTGQADDSRYVGGHLVLVFRDGLPWNTFANDPAAAPIAVEHDAVNGIPCDRIVKQAVHDFDTRFVKVVSLDARHPETAPQFAAAIGGGDQIYMTESTLYVTKAGIQWGGYGYDSYRYAQPVDEKLLVTKIDFNAETGAVSPSAAGVIDGHVKDQWAFKEYAVDATTKVLSVATSTGQLLGAGANVAQNHLWVLRQKETTLEVAAVVHDFGTGEDIRSVRYVNAMAYVVTFKKTDPLFAFDMANPLEPKLLGELKVPGFSVYMHPVAAGRMLGVGFDADDQGGFAWYQGLQVSLFDVSNPLDLKRLDNQIIGQRGSYSDVTGDHHAFYFDAAQMIVGLPVVELAGKGADTGPEMARELKFSGAIMYHIEDTKLTEAARLSHADLLPEACKNQLANGHWWEDKTVSLDINRLYSVDGKLLTVSRFGLKTWDLAHLDQPATATVPFPTEGAEAICGEPFRGEM